MSDPQLIRLLDSLKRENSRLRRILSVFANPENWVYAHNSDLLTEEAFVFTPSNRGKIQEKPWQYAARAIAYRNKPGRAKSAEEESKIPRFKKLV